jgi:hypothetical protein
VFVLSSIDDGVLSRHERYEDALGAYARAVREGRPAAGLRLTVMGREPRPAGAPAIDVARAYVATRRARIAGRRRPPAGPS